MDKVLHRDQLQWSGAKGEADRKIMSTKPKHLFSGKRKIKGHNRR